MACLDDGYTQEDRTRQSPATTISYVNYYLIMYFDL
jgi:hypothetical protein